MTSPSSPTRGRLIFHWPERSASFVFPVLFVAAVGVHALAFFGFQVVYPPAVAVMPPEAQVTLISASSPANAELMAWIDSQNPGKAPRLEERVPSGLGAIEYTPSYATVRTLPKPGDSVVREGVYPPAYDAISLLAPDSPVVVSPREAARSSLSFSEALRERDAGKAPTLEIVNRAQGSSLLPSVFLVGIGDRGEVQYVFLQSGSGHRALDEEAERILLKHEFSRKEGVSHVIWGFATFTWGADAFAPMGAVGSTGAGAPAEVVQPETP